MIWKVLLILTILMIKAFKVPIILNSLMILGIVIILRATIRRRIDVHSVFVNNAVIVKDNYVKKHKNYKCITKSLVSIRSPDDLILHILWVLMIKSLVILGVHDASREYLKSGYYPYYPDVKIKN